uniref:Uncharacterized protein n=1 Tax=Panagrolaimus sp. ES5 TaxID=591445 RepID=A0AC34FGH2_9BILA
MNKNGLLLQKQQFDDAYERLTTTFGTVTEELKVAKTREFHEHSSSKDLGIWIAFPLSPIKNPTKLIIDQTFIFQLYEMGEPEERTLTQKIDLRKFQVLRYKLSLAKEYSKSDFELSKDLGIWIAFPISPIKNPTKLIIDQTFIFQLYEMGEPEERTLTQKIDLRKFQVLRYKLSLAKEYSKSDFELFLTFVFLSWPQANIDLNSPNIQNLLNELESNSYFHKFNFDGWDMYYINSIDLKAFIYFPTSQSNNWTIYEGIHQMPKRIYFTANTRLNLELLLKRIQWFNNRNVQIHTVL